MADDGDLQKLHGLLEAMLGEQVNLGRALDRHLQNVPSGAEENGHPSDDNEKMQSILHNLQRVETEGGKLKLDLQLLEAQKSGHVEEHPSGRVYDEQIERLQEDVTHMAHTQHETETHLTELAQVLSTCLASLEHRPALPSGSAVGSREVELAAQVEALQKALQEEHNRNAELSQTIASLQQTAEEGQQARSALEKSLADEAKRATDDRLRLQAELEEAEYALQKERKLATKVKRRHDGENKKNMSMLKEQFGQIAALEGRVEELEKELASEKAQSQGAHEQVAEARLAQEQGERELQEMLRVAREEASGLKTAAAQTGARESEMATRIAELEEQLARQSEEAAAAVQRSQDIDDREASYRRQEEEMRRAEEERERGERDARAEALTAQLAQANEELARLKAIQAEREEQARLATERAVRAEQELSSATVEWTERQSQAERARAEEVATLEQLRARLVAFEARLPEIESRAVQRGREETQGDLERLRADYGSLSEQLKRTEKEAQTQKAEAESLRGELARISQQLSAALAAQAGGQPTRRKLGPEMQAAADSTPDARRQPTAASAAKDHDLRKVRRHSEPDKEQDITDLLQSDDVVHTRPRTMPAKASADLLLDESGQGLPAEDEAASTDRPTPDADRRTDPVEYLSEELALYLFAHLPVRDLLALTCVNRKYRRIASDATLWRPRCQRFWHFDERECSYTDADWKEVYVYRHKHYKQVSCVVVGDRNVGKKTLITAFEGMITQKGWKRGQEKHSCTVCVESLFGVPTMFNLTVLRASPSDPYHDLTHRLAEHLTRTKVDVFLVCVPAIGSIEATQERFIALEKNVLPALDALCPDVPRILVGTETDKKEEHYDHSHPTAVPLTFAQFAERLHFRATIFTSAMSNRGLVDLFEKAQALVATPNLLVKVSHDQVVVMNQTIRSKLQERKPPRSTALNSRASTQYGYADVAPFSTPLQTSPSSPRRQGASTRSPYVAPSTPASSTPYSPRGPAATPYPYASPMAFTPAASAASPSDAGSPMSPFHTQHVSQSTPLPGGERRSSLASASSAGSTPAGGQTARSRRHLRSSISDTPRTQRENKCSLQ